MSGGVTHVVVDGSNIATEGRSTPSLAQLESAVVELRREMPEAEVIVVVDATFAHRIEADERARFEQAALRGEYVYPPAGAIGRGDAFLLRIAQKIDATVLSNDSFQEFHGEHDWLFDRGRLLGGTPVPGVGWIFVPRTPVRGPKSRIAVRDAERSKSKVEKAIAAATREAVEPDAPKGQRKGKKKASDAAAGDGRAARQPQAVNDPLTFISFVAEHPLGSSLEGEVENFTSHGAVVRVGEMHCYVPLSGLGEPPPRSAREVLRKDERRTFVLTALDPQRRGVELALPAVAVVSGRPSEETVEAEVAMTQGRRRKSPAQARLAEPGAAEPPAAVKVDGKAAAATPGAAEVAAAAQPAKPARGRRKAAPPTEVEPAASGRRAAPRKKAGGEVALPAEVAPPASTKPAGRRRKEAAAAGVEPAADAPAPRAPRTRKAAATAPEPATKTTRTPKAAAAPALAPATKTTRTPKAAAAPAPAPATKATRARKIAVGAPAPEPPPPRTARTRKAAAPPPEPAPAAASKRSRGRKAPEPAPAPVPQKRSRTKATTSV